MLNLNQVRSEVERLAGIIGASGYILPTYGSTEDGGRPHIEIDAHSYHYIVVERGEELSRITTTSIDELLYHVFSSITIALATDYARANRVVGQDSRRQLWRRQVELLKQLSGGWVRRLEKEIAQILVTNPYTDRTLQNKTH